MTMIDLPLAVDVIVNLQLWIVVGMICVFLTQLYLPAWSFTATQLVLLAFFWPGYLAYALLQILNIKLHKRQASKTTEAGSPNKTLN